MPRPAFLAVAPLLFLAILPAAAVAADSPFEVVESKSSYESQGKTITVDRYEPKGDGKRPAVLVIHGAGGLLVGGPLFRQSGRELAKRGYVAHVVHYFELTDTKIAERNTMNKHYAAWMKAIADGVSNVSAQPNVDTDRVGLLGFSLGAYLSLSLAMVDPRVDAVVEYFGGLPPILARQVKTLPPVLILHGEKDKVVSIDEAHALVTLFKAKKVEYEIKLYPDQGHGFLGDDAADAGERTLAFFDKHLAPRKARKVARAVLKPEEVARPRTGEGGN